MDDYFCLVKFLGAVEFLEIFQCHWNWNKKFHSAFCSAKKTAQKEALRTPYACLTMELKQFKHKKLKVLLVDDYFCPRLYMTATVRRVFHKFPVFNELVVWERRQDARMTTVWLGVDIQSSTAFGRTRVEWERFQFTTWSIENFLSPIFFNGFLWTVTAQLTKMENPCCHLIHRYTGRALAHSAHSM